MWKLLLTTALTIGVAVTGSSFAHAATPTDKHVTIKVDWAFQGPESIFLYGQKLGFYKKNGVNPVIERGNGTGDVITQVAAGAVNFGWAGLGGLIKFDLQHEKDRLIAVYISEDNSPLAVITIKGRGISKPKDLEGKTISATAGAAGITMFPVFAKRAGIDASKVKWMHVKGQLRQTMMVRGHADALAGFTSSSILSIHHLGVPMDKIVALRYSDYGVQQYGLALIVRASYAKQHPETVAAVVKAVNAATKAAIKDPLASAQTLPSRDPLVKVATECIRLRDMLQHLTLSKNFKSHGLSTASDKRLDGAIQEIKTAFNISGDLTSNEIYTDKFLPPAKDRIPPSLGTCG